MLLSGEYFELLPDHVLTVPKTERIPLNDEYDRLIGFAEDVTFTQVKHVGITKLIKSKHTGIINDSVSLEKYMSWIFENANWNPVHDIDIYEFFDAYSKKVPSKSWGDFPKRGIEYHLGRVSLYNGLYEYYLFKKSKSGEWLNYHIPDWQRNIKEERRIILGLRAMANNKVITKYKVNSGVVELKLFCRIPMKEEIFLETYCWPLSYYKDKLKYIVPIEVWFNIRQKMEEDLGMIVEGV